MKSDFFLFITRRSNSLPFDKRNYTITLHQQNKEIVNGKCLKHMIEKEKEIELDEII